MGPILLQVRTYIWYAVFSYCSCTLLGKPVNRAGHIDYVPSLFTFTRRVDEVRKSEISERERRSIKRKLRELNHQPSCKVRRRSVRIRAEENASGDGEAEENGNGVHVSEEDAAEGNEDERNDAEENGDGVTEEDAAEGNEDERNDAEENGDRAEEQSILPGCVANETAIINQYTSTSIQAVPVPVVCYVPVTSVPSKSQFGVAIIEGNNEATKFYTGLATWKLFQYLLSFLVGAYPPQAKRSKISPANGLLLVLMRLRLNLRVEDLSYRFSISLSTVSDIFQRWIDLLFTHLSFLIHWPSQKLFIITCPKSSRISIHVQGALSIALKFLLSDHVPIKPGLKHTLIIRNTILSSFSSELHQMGQYLFSLSVGVEELPTNV